MADRWTKKDMQTLITLYPSALRTEIEEVLPNRTWRAIYHKANDSGLKRDVTGIRNSQWKGNDATKSSARRRVRTLYDVPEGVEVHHIDGNPWNNERSNLQFVTRKEHMIEDGRLAKLHESNRIWREQ